MARVLLSLAFLTLAAVPLARLGDVMAQESAILSIDPPAQTVGIDDGPFEVRVMVDNVTVPEGLGGYTVALSYDPEVIRALTIEDSGLLETTGNASVCPADAIDNDAGRLATICFTIPVLSEPGPQVSEPQVLTRITFEPVGEGTSELSLGDSSLVDPQGNGILVASIAGQVSVRAAPDADATPTPSSSVVDAGGGGPNVALIAGVIGGAIVGVAVVVAGRWLARQRQASRG